MISNDGKIKCPSPSGKKTTYCSALQPSLNAQSALDRAALHCKILLTNQPIQQSWHACCSLHKTHSLPMFQTLRRGLKCGSNCLTLFPCSTSRSNRRSRRIKLFARISCLRAGRPPAQSSSLAQSSYLLTGPPRVAAIASNPVPTHYFISVVAQLDAAWNEQL